MNFLCLGDIITIIFTPFYRTPDNEHIYHNPRTNRSIVPACLGNLMAEHEWTTADEEKNSDWYKRYVRSIRRSKLGASESERLADNSWKEKQESSGRGEGAEEGFPEIVRD